MGNTNDDVYTDVKQLDKHRGLGATHDQAITGGYTNPDIGTCFQPLL
jgi:hypothetical protein